MSQEVTLLSGEPARLRMRVQWVEDGSVGTIIAYDKSERYVWVRFDDGRKVCRSKKKLRLFRDVSEFVTAS